MLHKTTTESVKHGSTLYQMKSLIFINSKYIMNIFS